jgi:hypothetical protein
MAKAADDSRGRQLRPDSSGRLGAFEVDRRSLSHGHRIAGVRKQLFVRTQGRDREAVYLWVPIEQVTPSV